MKKLPKKMRKATKEMVKIEKQVYALFDKSVDLDCKSKEYQDLKNSALILTDKYRDLIRMKSTTLKMIHTLMKETD